MLYVFFISIIMILLIMGYMVTGGSNSRVASYSTEAAKAGALIADLETQIQFYYTDSESYEGFDNQFLADGGFHTERTNDGVMNKVDWENWPVGLATPYNGSYLYLGGTAGENMRILTKSIDNGKAVGVYLLKNKNVVIDSSYTTLLEKSLSNKFSFIGS